MTELLSNIYAFEIVAEAQKVQLVKGDKNFELRWHFGDPDIGWTEKLFKKHFGKQRPYPKKIELLFTMDQLTEENAKKVVESGYDKKKDWAYPAVYYKCYEPYVFNTEWLGSSVESFRSLIRSKGLSTECNYAIIKKLK